MNHLNENGECRMVDVGDKPVTARMARAESYISMMPETLKQIIEIGAKKGNVIEVARLAGIMAAKKTGELIPLCHPLGLDGVTLEILPQGEGRLHILATVRVTAKTGVEMEAMTAASVAALTIYDMCKGTDRAMVIGPIRLLEKTGGRSGHFLAE